MKRRVESREESPYSKRQKLTEEISSVEQLQSLLAFDQDATPVARQKIQAVKNLLEIIAYGEDAELRSSKKSLLLDYLKLQRLSQEERPSSGAFELLKTWSFAAQSNNEPLFASVTAVLALFLKAISRHVEFRDFGRNICYLILQKDQLKILERGLTTQKTRDHLICPSLRLLTELVSFDGGSSASHVYRAREITFKRFDTFLGLRNEVKAVGSGSRRKASIRDNALRYLFANLRLQDQSTKIEILSNGKFFRSVFQDIREDTPSIIREMLKVMKDYILDDKKIPRRIKGRIFTDHALASLATLYSYQTTDDGSEEDEHVQTVANQTIPKAAHIFLLSLCTTPAYGILLEKDDHHVEIEREAEAPDEEPSARHQDISLLSKSRRKRVGARNHNLASFLQSLRPHASQLQRDLVLAIFQAAPELISDYFSRKQTFSFEPKLTATWIGYAAFLLSTIQLPISGMDPLLPLSKSDLIERIVPLPLSPKVLSRCFNQSIMIIRFLAVKLLCAAFDKLAQVLAFVQSSNRITSGASARSRDTAIDEIVDEFGHRCPDMSHVIALFRSCDAETPVLREASAQLLCLYYQHLPQKALVQKLDVSTALLASINDARLARSENSLEPLLLGHLVAIAACSPDMRWFQKSDNHQLSLFGTGLELYATLPDDSLGRSLGNLLRSAFSESFSMDAYQAKCLLAFLSTSLSVSQALQPVLDFIDNCLARLSKKVVKYFQDFLELCAQNGLVADQVKESAIGALLIVMMEQWPFVQESMTASDIQDLSRWFSCFLETLARQQEDPKFVQHARTHLTSVTKDKQCKTILARCPNTDLPSPNFDLHLNTRISPGPHQAAPPSSRMKSSSQQQETELDEWQPRSPPAPENENHPGLTKWKTLPLDDAIHTSAIADLFLCLSSHHPSIRMQGLQHLRSLAQTLPSSSHPDHSSLYLLFGSLIETASINDLSSCVIPYFATALAARMATILTEPLHGLFEKINTFLLKKGPVWDLHKLPSYWVDRVFLHTPTTDNDDGAVYKEQEWLLHLLIDGLRTAQDMELYRKSHILEKVMAALGNG
ncbi:MAG: hypothetical protein Q9174_005738, partial [Haloplaca sp. 1 TL-2023]